MAQGSCCRLKKALGVWFAWLGWRASSGVLAAWLGALAGEWREWAVACLQRGDDEYRDKRRCDEAAGEFQRGFR